MHPKQLENIFSLSSRNRYDHFLIKVCDWEELWLLETKNYKFLTISVQPDIKCIPVWPHHDYGRAYAEDSKQHIQAWLTANVFMEEWLPRLHKNGVRIGVLSNLETAVWFVVSFDLRTDLENGLRSRMTTILSVSL